MKVEELIQKLQSFDPKLKVMIEGLDINDDFFMIKEVSQDETYSIDDEDENPIPIILIKL